MAEPLKNMYNYDSINNFALGFKVVYDDFDVEGFTKAILDDNWDNLELKARVTHISTILGQFLPSDYPAALLILEKVVADYSGFFGIIFPDFVEVYGQDEEHYDLSIEALITFTPHSSSEFAIRPFIINNEEATMQTMYKLANHENEHVRRLASEGCRPALPWGQALVKYKKDPSPIIPILEQLKSDPSLYVRKSVANNLNDISKTHPQLVLDIATSWYGDNDDTNWIVKHACRSLLKKGNKDILAIFGYHDSSSIEVSHLNQDKNSLMLGEDLTFSFNIKALEDTKLRLEYAIDYVKANGSLSRKVFKISELMLNKNISKQYTKKHSFSNLTTRKHHAGLHYLTLIVNGVELNKIQFELII